MNLVFKIAHEDPEPIPGIYSSDLQELISLLLCKNIEQRPTLDQLIQVDFVRWFLVGFMNHDGFEANGSNVNFGLTAQKILAPLQQQVTIWDDNIDRRYSDSAHAQNIVEQQRPRVSSFDQIGFASNYPNSNNSNSKPADLTPMEKMKMRKELEAKKREEEMKYAILKDGKQFKNSKTENNSGVFDQKIIPNSSFRRHESEKNTETSKKSALKSNGRNVIANLDIESFKNAKEIQLRNSKLELKNDSKSSFADTFKQNLEQTIQSQYFPEIKASFNKSKSMAKNFTQNEEKDDFPPDFDDFEDTWNNRGAENELGFKGDQFLKQKTSEGTKNSFKNNPKVSLFKQKIISKIGEPLFHKIYEFVSLNKRNGVGNKNVSLKDSEKRRGKFRKN